MLLPRQLTSVLDRVPLTIVQRVVSLVFAQAMKQHPGLFDRLGDNASRRYRFTPAELDWSFVIRPSLRHIKVYRKDKAPPVDAAASGPMVTLLALLEGRLDGDAVFFSRSLTLTGDMEAMLALRNALDDCDFDLPTDLSAAAGPFSSAFRRLGERVRDRALAGLA
nr:SCP2 sterol-binding domain-containing protein [uncultured Devosia sp.]